MDQELNDSSNSGNSEGNNSVNSRNSFEVSTSLNTPLVRQTMGDSIFFARSYNYQADLEEYEQFEDEKEDEENGDSVDLEHLSKWHCMMLYFKFCFLSIGYIPNPFKEGVYNERSVRRLIYYLMFLIFTLGDLAYEIDLIITNDHWSRKIYRSAHVGITLLGLWLFTYRINKVPITTFIQEQDWNTAFSRKVATIFMFLIFTLFICEVSGYGQVEWYIYIYYLLQPFFWIFPQCLLVFIVSVGAYSMRRRLLQFSRLCQDSTTTTSFCDSYNNLKAEFRYFNMWTIASFLHIALVIVFGFGIGYHFTFGFSTQEIVIQLYVLSMFFMSVLIFYRLHLLNGFSETLVQIVSERMNTHPDYLKIRTFVSDIKYGFSPAGIFITPSVFIANIITLIIGILSIVLKIASDN